MGLPSLRITSWPFGADQNNLVRTARSLSSPRCCKSLCGNLPKNGQLNQKLVLRLWQSSGKKGNFDYF